MGIPADVHCAVVDGDWDGVVVAAVVGAYHFAVGCFRRASDWEGEVADVVV
ncbi:hypothetical protein ES703_41029 [subsurface metagenome]